MFITKDYFPKHANITTKLKQILFTKEIREQSKESESLLQKCRKAPKS